MAHQAQTRMTTHKHASDMIISRGQWSEPVNTGKNYGELMAEISEIEKIIPLSLSLVHSLSHDHTPV